MQELEIVISAKSWDEAVQLLADIGIDDKTKITQRPINGLFMVKAEKETPLTEEEYAKIKDSPDIAIMGDSLSRERIAAVLDRIYDVETLLRKLLLHAYDLIDTFFEVFSASKYTKDFRNSKCVTRRGSLNPITSHLTLGEMKDILGVDLSWSKREAISAQELHELLQSVSDVESLKSEFATKVKAQTVWDVIAENVLKTKTTWTDVHSELKSLKEFRDKSAHYQVITEREKEKLIQKADELLTLLNPPKRKLTKTEQANLSSAAQAFAEIAKQFKPITFPPNYYQNLIANSVANIDAFKVIGRPAQDAMANIFKQSAQWNQMLAAQRGMLSAYNFTQNINNADDPEDGEQNDDTPEDDKDDPEASAPVVRA